MIVSAHAAAGAAIGSIMRVRKFKDWLKLVAAGLVSHVVLDLVPYWYPEHPLLIALDFALAFVFAAAVIKMTERFCPVLVATVAAVIPDLEHLLIHYSILMDETLFISHRPWFPRQELLPHWGILLQALFIIFFLWLAIYSPFSKKVNKSRLRRGRV